MVGAWPNPRAGDSDARDRVPNAEFVGNPLSRRQGQRRSAGGGLHGRRHSKKNAPQGVQSDNLVDLRGIEPLTSSMPRKRAPAAPQARSLSILSERQHPSNGIQRANDGGGPKRDATASATDGSFAAYARSSP